MLNKVMLIGRLGRDPAIYERGTASIHFGDEFVNVETNLGRDPAYLTAIACRMNVVQDPTYAIQAVLS